MIRRLPPLIVFAALACILLWPALFGGRVLLPGTMLGRMSPWNATAQKAPETYWNALTWDSIAYFYPSRSLLGRELAGSRTLPLWNPYQMCGAPFLADFQSAVLYLPNWLFAVIPPASAFGWLAFLHLFAAGSFTYLFLRGLGLRRSASTFGGVAFMLSGFAITWLELPVFLSTAIWLPLALHYSRVAHDTGQGRYTAVAGIAIGLSLLGGHPQIAFYGLLAVGLYWLYLASGRHKTSLFRTLVLAGLTFGFGIALAAPQIYPAIELAQFSHRGGAFPTMQGYAAYSSLALPWRNLVSLFIPYFFGNPAKGSFTEFAEYCGYIGILPLLLAFSAFGLKDRARKQAWFFGGLAVLALLMALGTGINRLFYFGIPGFSHSGSPSRVLFLFMFSTAVLGAIGLDRIMKDDDKRANLLRITLPGAAVLITGIVLTHLNLQRAAGEYTERDLFNAIMPEFSLFIVFLLAGLAVLILPIVGKVSRQVGGVITLVVLAADLLAFGASYNTMCSPSEVYAKTPTTALLAKGSGYGRIMPLNDRWSLNEFPKAVLPPNAGTAYGLFDVQGYDSLYPVRYKALLDAVGGHDSCPPENGNMLFASNPQSPVYDLMGVKWIVSRQPMKGARKMPDGCYLYRNTDTLPHAFLVHTIEYADDEECLARMTKGQMDPRVVVLANANDAERLDPWKLDFDGKPDKPAASDSVIILDYECNRVRMAVRASQPSVLVLTDQFFPGWTASVDKKRVEITQVDYLFRGVPVRTGMHTVEFAYFPESYDKGLRLMKIALVMLAGIAIYAVAHFFHDRRPGAAS